MSDFDSLMAEADTEVMAAFAAAGTLDLGGGNSRSIAVIVDRNVGYEGPDGSFGLYETVLSFQKSALEGAAAVGSNIIVGGRSYRLAQVLKDDGQLLEMVAQ